MIDCDDTLFPARREELLSEKVIQTMNQASKVIHIGIATHRSLLSVIPILKRLKLSGPSVISGGARIIDAQTYRVLWEKTIDERDFFRIIKIIENMDVEIFFTEDEESRKYRENYQPRRILEIGIYAFEESAADKLIEKLSAIERITPHKVLSLDPSKYGIVITHSEATKQYGIFEVAKILKINTHDIIGIGDSYNDFPLLMACGLKVAIGNAVDELKEISDYIAPSVYEDGVAEVINKFVLC